MFPLDLLREPVWQPLTWTLLHFLWQGLAVAAAVAMWLYVWPVRRAHNRYLIYLSALIAMAACPLVTFMVIEAPESKMEAFLPLAAEPELELVATEMPVRSTDLAVLESQPPLEPSVAVASEVEDYASLPVPVTSEARLPQYVAAIQPYCLVIWLGGVLLLAMRLSLSWLHVRWLAWGRGVIPADLAARAATLGERLGLRFPPRVCISEKIREAIVVGLWRPLVLLPASWLTEMTPEVLEAVIAHELAHVRRLDLWVNLLQRLMETLLFYHPAVWWLSRCVSLQREMCADELAVGATSERLAYATALEQLGRMRLGQTAPQLGAGIGGKRMVLLSRVGNILGFSASTNRARWWPVALLALAVPLAIWLASTSIVASTENETRVEEGDPSTSEKLDMADLKRWVEKANSPVQSEFDAAVEALVAMGPGVAQEMISLLKTGRTGRLGRKVLESLAPEPSVQRILVNAIEEARDNRAANVVYCALLALGKSGNVAHADFIATFLETHDIAATYALATLGGERARDHLIGAFDIVETERWFMLAGTLELLGDSAAVPELKKRLAQVELPPNDRFPPATVGAMTRAIAALSGEKETFTTTEFCQGQHFRYPFGRPGWPKTFSVNPLRDHYVRPLKVDPQSKAGREAIWKAMEEATEGPGFTIDGNEVVAFHGLKMAPLWPDGRPYPITLYDWLRQTSHQVLRSLIDQEKQTDRRAIPKSGLLVTLDPAGRLYVLSLKRTSDQFTYNVTVMPQDPNMQLIPVGADAEDMQLTRITGCTLYDLESETRNGSLNLSRGHLETMTPKKWQEANTDAVLVVEFSNNGVALAVPGAERFLLAEASDAWEKPEKALALLRATAKEEPTIPGHKIVKREGGVFHVFPELSKGRKFAFAVKMPDGTPVAGVLEVRTVDRKAETLNIHHRFLPTAAARDVFAMADAGGADAPAWGKPVGGDDRIAQLVDQLAADNPLGLDDATLINLFRAGSVLRRVAFDCESYYSDHDRLPKDVPELATRYQEQGRDGIGNDPFAPGKKLRLLGDEDDSRLARVWSVGPDGDWDGGRQIDSTKKPLDGDVGVEIRVGQTDWHWLADEGIRRHLEGKRLAHYLAAKGPKLPKPELKEDGLKWGPVVDGLQLAVELTPKKDAYLLGETIDVRFHVRNAADYAIQVGLAMPMRQDMTERSVFIHDEKGKRLKGQGIWMSGMVGTKQKTLKPGETASYNSSDLAFVAPGKRPGTGAVGHWVEAAAGVYTVQFKQHFPIGYGNEPREWQGVMETAPVTVRIAEQPKFAIHRVMAYRKPGDQPGMTNTIYLRDSGKPERFDSMRPERYPLDDLVLDGTPIITESDITTYDWRRHLIQLTPEAYERFIKAVKPSVWGVPFVVQADGTPVYLGAFWTAVSSYSADMPTISLDRLDGALPVSDPNYVPANAIRIENFRVLEEGELPTDPRGDQRLYRSLQAAGKLLDLRSQEPPWGKPVEGVQMRVTEDKFTVGQGGKFDLRVDLRNRGKQDRRIELEHESWELEIDGKWHSANGGVSGDRRHLPLAAGQTQRNVEVWDWLWPDIAETVRRLPPGKHTLRVARRLPYFGVPRNPPPIRVVSNPVEIEIVARQAEPNRESKQLVVDLILAEGNLRETPSFWIGYEQLSEEALRERATRLLKASPELKVVVRADGAIPQERVVELLDLLKAVGAKDVSMAVFPLGSVFAIDPGPGRDGTIRGKVIGPDEEVAANRGEPVNYVVMLDHEAWTNLLGELPNMEVAVGETFEFRNVPAGKCKVQARPVTAAGQDAAPPAKTVEVEVIVKNKQVVEVEVAAAGETKVARPVDADARQRFLAIERLARLPMPQQAKQLPSLYKDLAPRYMNPFVEGILSSYRENILDPDKFDGPGGDHTTRWAQQLADVASEMTPEQVADKLEFGLWLNVAARARAIQIFKKHAEATAALIEADLSANQKQPVERAAATILAVDLRTFTDRLLAMYIEDADVPEGVYRTLLFLRDPAVLRPLLEEVEKDPKFLARCAGLFQGPLYRKPAEPLLLGLLNSADAEIRYGAIRAVYECSDGKLAQPAVELAHEKEARLRSAAAQLASNLPGESFAAVRDALLPLLSDKEETVRFDALRCFAQQKDLAAGPVILKLLKQDQLSEQFKVTVMQAMSKLAGSNFNYYMHEWGPDRPDNQRAIEKFEAWLLAHDTDVSITGEVTGIDGKPAVGYRVTALPGN